MRQVYIEPEASEKKYQELRARGTELKIPVFEQYLGLELFDKAGKHLLNTKQRSHSWVRNAYNLLVMAICCVDSNGGALPSFLVLVES